LSSRKNNREEMWTIRGRGAEEGQSCVWGGGEGCGEKGSAERGTGVRNNVTGASDGRKTGKKKRKGFFLGRVGLLAKNR